MRVILGDQSVVITKVLILVWRRRTCGFALFRVLVRVSVEVQPRQVIVLAVCSSCGNKRGTSESKEF